jgi:hypothetical protein
LGKSDRKKFDEGCLASHPAIIHIGEDSKKKQEKAGISCLCVY